MNKNLLLACILAGTTLIGVTGCGDDPPVVEGNPTFSFKENQSFTYESTPRDTAQNPTAADKRDVKWTVLDTGMTYANRNSVSMVRQDHMAADGTTIESSDTLYFQTNANGEFFQYDLFGSVVRRVPAAAVFVNEIPKTWTKIGDTKNSSALDYTATGESMVTITVSNVPVQVTYSVRGAHKGKTSVTVPFKTEANAFSTDLIVKLKATALNIPIVNDSLTMNSVMNVTDGILQQSLQSKTIGFKDPLSGTINSETVLGFDMKLKAKQ